MDAAMIIKLRPTDDTASAIRKALGEVRAVQIETARRLEGLRAGNSLRLLSGTAKELEAARKEAASLEADVEDLREIEAALVSRLRERERCDEAEALKTHRAAMVAVVDAHAARWAAEYEGHAKAIAELLDSERAALKARTAYADALNRFYHRGGQVTADLELPPSKLVGAVVSIRLLGPMDSGPDKF